MDARLQEPPAQGEARAQELDLDRLDLDRLVWDPEYREAMRHYLKDDS